MLVIVKKVALIVACLFALLWLLSSLSLGFSAPSWVPPSFAVAICVAVFL